MISPISRREWLTASGCGFGALALAGLSTNDSRANTNPLAAGLTLQVNGQAFLVTIQAEKVSADAVDKRRTPLSRFIADSRSLDLDDLSTKVGQVLRTPRAGEDARQIEHSHAAQTRIHILAPFAAVTGEPSLDKSIQLAAQIARQGVEMIPCDELIERPAECSLGSRIPGRHSALAIAGDDADW